MQWLEEFLLPWFDRSDSPDVECWSAVTPLTEELLACGRWPRVIAPSRYGHPIDGPAWNVPGQLRPV